jgi:hypothetical protein
MMMENQIYGDVFWALNNSPCALPRRSYREANGKKASVIPTRLKWESYFGIDKIPHRSIGE